MGVTTLMERLDRQLKSYSYQRLQEKGDVNYDGGKISD